MVNKAFLLRRTEFRILQISFFTIIVPYNMPFHSLSECLLFNSLLTCIFHILLNFVNSFISSILENWFWNERNYLNSIAYVTCERHAAKFADTLLKLYSYNSKFKNGISKSISYIHQNINVKAHDIINMFLISNKFFELLSLLTCILIKYHCLCLCPKVLPLFLL